MDAGAIRETLGRHLRRPIRAFLADPRVAGTEVEEAFWDAVYANVSDVEHAEAVRLAAYHEHNPAPVESMLEGIKGEP